MISPFQLLLRYRCCFWFNGVCCCLLLFEKKNRPQRNGSHGLPVPVQYRYRVPGMLYKTAQKHNASVTLGTIARIDPIKNNRARSDQGLVIPRYILYCTVGMYQVQPLAPTRLAPTDRRQNTDRPTADRTGPAAHATRPATGPDATMIVDTYLYKYYTCTYTMQCSTYLRYRPARARRLAGDACALICRRKCVAGVLLAEFCTYSSCTVRESETVPVRKHAFVIFSSARYLLCSERKIHEQIYLADTLFRNLSSSPRVLLCVLLNRVQLFSDARSVHVFIRCVV